MCGEIELMYCVLGELLESSTAEKDLVAAVAEKPRTRQQCPSGARKANGILGCTNRGVAAGREGTVPSALPS